jgi:hypothetical protein
VPEDIENLKEISDRLAAIQAKFAILQAEIHMLKLINKILEDK